MSDAEVETPPQQANIPSAWWSLAALSEALAVLAANPDLIGADVELALESEAPDALVLLDALIADSKYAEYTAEADLRYLRMVQVRAGLQATRLERKKALVVQVMQKLGLKNRRTAAGTAFWSTHKGGVIITDDTLIPATYKTAKPVEYSVDKKAIGRDLDENIEVPGAIRANGGVSLTIKG